MTYTFALFEIKCGFYAYFHGIGTWHALFKPRKYYVSQKTAKLQVITNGSLSAMFVSGIKRYNSRMEFGLRSKYANSDRGEDNEE